MKTEKIITGHGDAEELATIAKQHAEKSKKEANQEGKKTGYKPPKYEPVKDNRKDGSSEGDKKTEKIVTGHGYVKDFESWVNEKINKTKKENK